MTFTTLIILSVQFHGIKYVNRPSSHYSFVLKLKPYHSSLP